jgi:hypothetical protein
MGWTQAFIKLPCRARRIQYQNSARVVDWGPSSSHVHFCVRVKQADTAHSFPQVFPILTDIPVKQIRACTCLHAHNCTRLRRKMPCMQSCAWAMNRAATGSEGASLATCTSCAREHEPPRKVCPHAGSTRHRNCVSLVGCGIQVASSGCRSCCSLVGCGIQVASSGCRNCVSLVGCGIQVASSGCRSCCSLVGCRFHRRRSFW